MAGLIFDGKYRPPRNRAPEEHDHIQLSRNPTTIRALTRRQNNKEGEDEWPSADGLNAVH